VIWSRPFAKFLLLLLLLLLLCSWHVSTAAAAAPLQGLGGVLRYGMLPAPDLATVSRYTFSGSWLATLIHSSNSGVVVYVIFPVNASTSSIAAPACVARRAAADTLVLCMPSVHLLRFTTPLLECIAYAVHVCRPVGGYKKEFDPWQRQDFAAYRCKCWARQLKLRIKTASAFMHGTI
jgi:hypothetical protein